MAARATDHGTPAEPGVRSDNDVAFECALGATRGRRPYQEDAAIFWPGDATYDHGLDLPTAAPDKLVAILADGMGGHAGGAVASKIACRTCLSGLAGLIDLAPFHEEAAAIDNARICGDADDPTDEAVRETTMRRSAPPWAAPGFLTASLLAANAEIADHADRDCKLTGMGTTLVAATFSPAGLEWVSVGDSPLYLMRNREIKLMNEDHSLAPTLDQLACEGHITPEAARADPSRHMLRSALTGEPLDLVDRCSKPLQLRPGDIVILASDGLQTLSPGDIARLVTAEAAASPDRIATTLIEAVERRRETHQDNATVMVICVPA
jgi:serine/threonine protein phosphatase PrpC